MSLNDHTWLSQYLLGCAILLNVCHLRLICKHGLKRQTDEKPELKNMTVRLFIYLYWSCIDFLSSNQRSTAVYFFTSWWNAPEFHQQDVCTPACVRPTRQTCRSFRQRCIRAAAAPGQTDPRCTRSEPPHQPQNAPTHAWHMSISHITYPG